MAGFIYFVADQQSIDLAQLRALGLGYAFDRAPMTAAHDGPNNKRGLLVADEKRLGQASFAYRPDDQVWRPIPGTPAYVGFYRDARPTPEDLLRDEVMQGEFVELPDRNRWLVPRLRYYSTQFGFQTALPVDYDVDDAGNWVVDGAAGEFAELDAVGQRLLDGMFRSELDEAPRLTVAEALETAVTLLAVNYAVSKVELGRRVLALLRRDDTLMAICRAAVDYETAVEWAQKKTDSATPAVAVG